VSFEKPGDDNVVQFPKTAEERRALRKAKEALEKQRLINVFIDEVGGEAAACLRWCRQHPDPDPNSFDLLFGAELIRTVDARRLALLDEIIRLADQEPSPEIAAAVAKAASDTSLIPFARLPMKGVWHEDRD
jgi:hypothetical protein